MRTFRASLIPVLVMTCTPVFGQEANPTASPPRQGDREVVESDDSWSKALEDRAKRGTLHDVFQYVRGDSGKWNDEPIRQHAPPIGIKPAKMSLDDWADQLLEQDLQVTRNDDNLLLFRTRQLDDNDRVWIERIERRGNRFTVVLNQAIWQGRYQKTFTYYSVLGVNLGQLEPGKYEATWVVKPLVFTQFDGDGRPTDNWPKSERPAKEKSTELHVTFDVVAEVP